MEHTWSVSFSWLCKRVLLALIGLFALSGCQLTARLFTNDSVASISGKLNGYGTISSLSVAASPTVHALACTAPTASLYEYTANGERREPALSTQNLAADGSYSFNTKALDINLSALAGTKSYVVVVKGCAGGIYMRPITGKRNQDVSAGSSLVAYVLDTAYKTAFAQRLQTSGTTIETLINQLSGATNFSEAYQTLSSTPALADQFQTVFGFTPSTLSTAAPEIKLSTLPTTASEQVSFTASVEVSHWSDTYPIAYEWSLDGLVVSRLSTLTYAPNANQQGAHTLAVSVGSDDGAGHIDQTKEKKTLSNQILVTNNILPVPPAFSVTVPTVSGTTPINSRNLTTTLVTGAAKSACESFSHLLITETSTPPDAGTTFPISCSQAVTQDQAYTLVSSGDGLKTLYLWAVDASGAISTTPTQTSFYLDTAAPTATISTTPLALSNHTTESFAFESVDNGGVLDHFDCQLDGGAWTVCSSPTSYSGLAEGDHTFSVRSTDTAGNTSNTPSKTWHVDLTAPVLTLSGTPLSVTNQVVSTFAFSAVDSGGGTVQGFSCSMDGGSFASCTSPFLTTVGAGSHSFAVKTLDTVGNASAAQTYSWIVDTTGPTTTISSKPATLTNSAAASFSFAATDTGGSSVAGYECSLDGGGYASCTSPSTYSSLTAGGHAFSVRATDAAGNIGTIANYSWTIDFTTPMASITARPNDLTNSSSASFTFSATAPPAGSITGYECSLDGGNFGACTSPKTYSSLAENVHSFSVRSIDNNNARSTPVSVSWTVDLTSPVVTLSSQPLNPTSETSGVVAFSAVDTGGGAVAGFECAIDGGSFGACSSPKSYPSLGEGSHSVVVRALDTAGNTSASQTATWIVDTTPPIVGIGTTPNSVTNSQAASITFSATDTASAIAGYTCSVDGAAYAACTSPFSLSSLAAGAHTFSVKATDAAGNVTASPTTYAWTVDLVAPVPTWSSTPSSVTNQTQADFTFTATDSGGGSVANYLCQLDSTPEAACTSPASYPGLAAGAHSLNLKAVDTAGNISNAISFSWTVDLVAPVVAITTPATNGTIALTSNLSAFTVSGTCTENGRIVTISGATSATPLCTSGVFSANLNLSALSDGTLSLTASQTDVAGNTGSSAARTIVKETVAPAIAITSIASLKGGSSTTFSWALTEDHVAASTNFTVDLYNGTSWSTVGSVAATSGLNSGTNYSSASITIPSVDTSAAKIRVSLTDAAGNATAQVSSDFMIDSTSPVVTILSSPSNPTNATTASFMFLATDVGIGTIASYSCQLDGGSFASCTSPKAYSSLAAGSHTFAIKATDGVGNTSTASTSTWVVDLTAPTVTITTPASSGLVATASGLSTYAMAGACSENGRTVSITGAVSAATACTAGAWSTTLNLTSLSDGSATLSATQNDAAGNSTTVSTSTIVDKTNPAVSLTSFNSGVYKGGASGSITWTATDTNLATAPISLLYSSDSGSTWTSIATGLSNSGTYTWTLPTVNNTTMMIKVTAVDKAGNTTSAVSSSTFTIDSTAPTTSITSNPASPTNATTATFGFSGSDTGGSTVASYQCQLDSGGYSSCTSTKSYSSLTAGSHTFYVKATDAVGNAQSTATTYTWTVDLTAPTLTITTPSTNGTVALATGLPSVTLAGACSENGINVAITGAVTGSASCASGAWSTNLNLNSLSDGTATLTATQTDVAGNSTAVSRTMIVDKTNPTVSLTSFNNGAYAGGSTVNITWSASDTNIATTPITLAYSTNSGSTWTTIAAAQANTGTYAWTLPTLNTTTAMVKVTAVDAAGNSNSAQSASVFTIDSTLPTLSSMTVSGSAIVTSNNVPLNLTASDNYKITHFCFQYNTTTKPLLTDGCWIPVASAGQTPGTSLSFSNYYFRVGFAGGSYTINAWIRDEAGNISSLTSTPGVDTGAVTYSPGSPPAMTSVLAVSNNASTVPPTSSDLTTASGSTVYIYWQASDANALPSNAIDLSYTTNDTTWTPVTGGTGLPNSQGTGCTLFGAYTGCFKWTNGSPTSSYFKVQAKVTNSATYSALNASPALNANAIKFLAGNTNVGTNASATAGVFLATVQNDIRQFDQGTLVVHPNGTIFFKDTSRGILKIDPATGLTSILLSKTGTTSGDGGAVTSATARTTAIIALDKDNNLLVYDYDRIRKINLALGTPTISTIIGGGSSTADTQVSATSLKLTGGYNSSSSGNNGMFPLPNGDIIFRSESGPPAPRMRWYHAVDGSITTVYFSGTNVFPGAGAGTDVSTCWSAFIPAPVIDNTGTMTGFFATVLASPTGATSCSYDGGYHTQEVYFSTAGTVITNLGVSGGGQAAMHLGRDRFIYRFAKYNLGLQKFNPATLTWSQVTVAGGTPCNDGATFSTCQTPYDDIFVDLSGKIYLADNGRIRTVTDSGTLLTLAGQSLNYGEGLTPLQARFGTIQSFGLWNDGTQDKIITLDTQEHYLREIGLSSSGTVSAIAGTGASGNASSGSTALTTPIFDCNSTNFQKGVGVDSSGNVYLSTSSQAIGFLNRSTGQWTRIGGGGATDFYSAAENTLATSIKYSSGNGVVQIIGFDHGQLVLGVCSQVGSYCDHPSYKLIDQSTYKQTSLTSSSAVNVTNPYTFSVSGTALSDVLVSAGSGVGLSTAYDSTSASWYASQYSSDKNLYKLVPGGNLTTYFTSSSGAILNFAYYRASSSIEYFYICDGSWLSKVTMTNGTFTSQTNLSRPISSVSCTGNKMIYSPSRSSLLFVYQQNGLYGIAEYPNP